MKRRIILISALVMIAIVSGIAISQLISNTTNFAVHVDGTAPLHASKMQFPSGTIYQDQMYTDAVLVNVTNLDSNQGYDFYLTITVKTTTSGNTLAPGSVIMSITSSTDNQATFGNARTIAFTQDATPDSVTGTYLASQLIPIAAYNSGGVNQVFFDISFEMTSVSSGNYEFDFTAAIA
jgi:hypothetical protein